MLPFLLMRFRIFRIITTDKINDALHRLSKQNDHLLYLYLVVFILTFFVVVIWVFPVFPGENDARFIYIYRLISRC